MNYGRRGGSACFATGSLAVGRTKHPWWLLAAGRLLANCLLTILKYHVDTGAA
jgi:hypothetical protein